MRTLLPAFALALGVTTTPAPASAFSTRVHIMISNKVRDGLIESGTNQIQLKFGASSVVVDKDDAQAIIDQPLAFRAGAIGPDNMMFPGMTDPSHALEQRPFEQCELLYKEAITPDERAYALGCFLHGSTDAIAHHYVNYMSGETFTLTPVSSGMQSGFENAVRHIVAESMIQDAASTQDPEAFSAGQLLHTIPKGFVLRTYFDMSSPVWQRVAEHSKSKFDAAIAANPNANLVTVIANSGLAPAEHLVMTPVYVGAIDAYFPQLEEWIEGRIAEMQDWNTPEGNQLQLLPGSDGVLGTMDDEALCTAGCPLTYAWYFTYVGLLAPRYDANNNPLPSAFEKITEELRGDLKQFNPALLDTIEKVSTKLNAPNVQGDKGLGFAKSDVATLFAPMKNWADDITALDYEALTHAVLPEWIIALSTTFENLGVSVDMSGILKAVFEPGIKPIKDAIKTYAIDQAELFVGDLADEYTSKLELVEAEYTARLDAAAAPGLSGNALGHFYSSGLFGHSFNITAAVLANHAVVLPVGEDAIGVGPASFDASYLPTWMQAGVCDYLQREVFPLGLDVKALLSVREDVDYPAQIAEDSPVECHEGSLLAFAEAPTVQACTLTTAGHLIDDPAHLGSTSRAYPPALSAKPVTCQNIVVPGLPEPLEGTGGAGGSGVGGGGDGSADSDASPSDEGDCSCALVGSTSTGPLWPLAGMLLSSIAILRRRRRASGRLAAFAVGVAASIWGIGCGGEGSSGDSSSESSDSATGAGGEGGDAAGPVGSGGGAGGTVSVEADKLLDELGNSVWHGEQTRDGKARAYELHFDATSLLWAEIRNPFGPARKRQMRSFTVDSDGASVHSTVLTPAGWPVDAENGSTADWTFEVVAGSPRTLRISGGGGTEEFVEGQWPAPTSGLTAEVRFFESGGPIEQAFCNSGLNGFDYNLMFDFARGKSAEPVLAYNVVAGAKLLSWHDGTGNNQFAITDVAGFDTLGGTELSDQYNFFVRYSGSITHPGGDLWLSEADDAVEDGVWAFIGSGVGSNNTGDVFLEVHGFAWPELTANEVVASSRAGEVPIEIVVARCAKQIQDVDVHIAVGAGPYSLVGDTPSTPLVNDTLFPPAL